MHSRTVLYKITCLSCIKTFVLYYEFFWGEKRHETYNPPQFTQAKKPKDSLSISVQALVFKFRIQVKNVGQTPPEHLLSVPHREKKVTLDRSHGHVGKGEHVRQKGKENKSVTGTKKAIMYTESRDSRKVKIYLSKRV